MTRTQHENTNVRTRSTPDLLATLTGLPVAEAEAIIQAAHYDLFALPRKPVLEYAIFIELLHRAVNVAPNRKIPATPENIVRACMPYRSADVEHLLVASLNNQRPIAGIKALNVAAIGTANGVEMNDSSVLKWPLLHDVSDFVIIHTHTHDDPNPSANDIAVTIALSKTARLLNLRLIDHIIISNSTHFSMREKGLIQ